MIITNKTIKLLGFAGILGGIIMLIGDWLFYFTITSGQDFHPSEVMKTMSDNRLSIGGALGPIASIFYSLGAISIYFALKSVNPKIAFAISALLIILFINTGAYHALYPMYGFIAKIDNPEIVKTLKGQLSGLMGILYNIQFVVGLVITILFFYIVLVKNTPYPKWIVIFFPTILSLFSDVARLLPAPIGGFVNGSWDNGWFVIFFCLTTYHYSKKSAIFGNQIS